MGMTSAFQKSKANFEGMDGTRELFLDDVIHKVFVRVDEVGTEAAASTVQMMQTIGAGPKQYPDIFYVDHPFLFFILDQKHGHILFMGRVVDPTK